MLVDCQNFTHPRELRFFWYTETEQNTSWYFWHKTSLSLDLQGEPYTEMLFDIVLVSPPIYWVAIEIGSFHSHHADSYGSLLSALGPPPAFGKNGPLFVLAFYAGRSVLFPQMPRAFHNGSVSWLHFSAWRPMTVWPLWSESQTEFLPDLDRCSWSVADHNAQLLLFSWAANPKLSQTLVLRGSKFKVWVFGGGKTSMLNHVECWHADCRLI
jgi:hypothetical protein